MFVFSRYPAVTEILHHIHAPFYDITCAEYISTTWYWIPLLWHPSHATVQSYCVLQHLTTFPVGLPATVKLMVQKYNVLMVPSCGCVITGDFNILITLWNHGRMMPFQWDMLSVESWSGDQICWKFNWKASCIPSLNLNNGSGFTTGHGVNLFVDVL
jgi:hypothetical protein